KAAGGGAAHGDQDRVRRAWHRGTRVAGAAVLVEGDPRERARRRAHLPRAARLHLFHWQWHDPQGIPPHREWPARPRRLPALGNRAAGTVTRAATVQRPTEPQ